jgi:hypothetical protein
VTWEVKVEGEDSPYLISKDYSFKLSIDAIADAEEKYEEEAAEFEAFEGVTLDSLLDKNDKNYATVVILGTIGFDGTIELIIP